MACWTIWTYWTYWTSLKNQRFCEVQYVQYVQYVQIVQFFLKLDGGFRYPSQLDKNPRIEDNFLVTNKHEGEQMNITPEIRKAHERLGQTSVQFLEFISQNPQFLKAENYKVLQLDSIYQLQSWPTFVCRKTRDEMEAISLKVLNIMKSIPFKVFGGDLEQISQFYDIPKNLAKYILDGITPEDISNLFSRGDFVMTNGDWKCVEYNVNSNLGGLQMQLPLWQSLFLKVPFLVDFLKNNNKKILNEDIYVEYFHHLIAAARQHYPNESGPLNFVVALPENYQGEGGDPATQEKFYNDEYKKILKNYEGLSGEVIVAGYTGLNVSQGKVYCKGRRIHIILEWYQGFVPAFIRDVFKARNVLIYNGPISWLLSAKSNLALLSQSEESQIFSPEERTIIKKHIPWTRKVIAGKNTYRSEIIDMKTFIIKNREKLVLKPVLGFGGIDVFIGRYTSETVWRGLVERALNVEDWRNYPVGDTLSPQQWQAVLMKAVAANHWIVQEYATCLSNLFPAGENEPIEHSMIWGFFNFGSRPGGYLLRALPKDQGKGVINGLQGAKFSVVFDIDE